MTTTTTTTMAEVPSPDATPRGEARAYDFGDVFRAERGAEVGVRGWTIDGDHPTRSTIYSYDGGSIVGVEEWGVGHPGIHLRVQSFDAYGRQLELSLTPRREVRRDPSTDTDVEVRSWRLSVYSHPGRRREVEVSGEWAQRFRDRFLDLCVTSPSLLWNPDRMVEGWNGVPGVRYVPRNQGFVALHEAMMRMAEDYYAAPNIARGLKWLGL